MQPSQTNSALGPSALSVSKHDKSQDQSQSQNRVILLELDINNKIQQASSDLSKYTKTDQHYKRRDTVEIVKNVLQRIKDAISLINKETENVRERLYYLIYNATIIIFNACHQLRVSNFSREATQYLAFNVLCLDNNLILTTTKYLDWRILNYVELSRAYSDLGAFKAATKVINYSIAKVLYSKQVEEQDPPVPEGTKDSLIDALRVLRTQELKYELQSGSMTPDAWKKKLEETFANNKYHRSLAIVECLQFNEPFSSGERPRTTKSAQIKTTAMKLVIELIRPDVELVKQALVQIHEKKKRDRERKDKSIINDNGEEADPAADHFKVIDSEMIQEKDWKFASTNVPIEIHIEIIKLAYECQLWQEFEQLLDPALVRLKFRRYEIPYIATIDVLMSANKQALVPAGFEKIPKDLNQANLRIELKKLRASAKKALPSDVADSANEPKKEEAKKGAPPAKDVKGGKKDPKASSAPAEEENKKADQDEIKASEAELDVIRHIYVNLLIQRSKNPQNAIVGVNIVMADENLGPDLPDHHFAVAVPIRQHPGVYEKNQQIPYVVFRRTANSLIDEEDSLSIITDICIIMGQDPNLRAPLGFTRIDTDLRQTPKDLERVPNLDYVFVCIKTDKQLALAERDLLVLRRLAELEKSVIAKGGAEFSKQDEAKQFLHLNFNSELLLELANTMREALLGPLGDFYLEKREDMLNEISALLWTKYLLPILKRIDYFIEMRTQKELHTEFQEQMEEAVLRFRYDFIDVLTVINRVQTRTSFVLDIVLYCKCAIQLSCLQEETGQFRNSVQALRAALAKVVEYREDRMKRSVDSSDLMSASTAMSICVDNKKIGDLENKIDVVFDTWLQLILRKERERVRREHDQPQLDLDEADEETFEEKRALEELRDKDLFERQIDIPSWKEEDARRKLIIREKAFSEVEQVVHSLHVDILFNLYRSEIKLGKEMQKIKNQTKDLLISQGIDLEKNAPGNLTKNLSKSLTKKMSQSKSKTIAENKSALKNLQQTLQETGKLPLQKPNMVPYEKILEKENNNNTYQNALLYLALAISKTNQMEQQSLLLEAQKFIKIAQEQENKLTNLALDNAVYLRASRQLHRYFKKNPNQIHPYDLLAKSIYQKKTVVPQKPILICRTSTSITMKLPFFKPLTEYKAWKQIGSVALFGKPSGSGVAVSLNNTDYEGTGERVEVGQVVDVQGLIPNESYVFAAAGYTQDGTCVNGIGETSDEVVSLLPLSLHLLTGYLAEVAFKLGQFQLAKQAAEELCRQFLIKNNIEYSLLDCRTNPILAFKLDWNYFSRISQIEQKQIAEAFLILAKVSKILNSDIIKKAEVQELQLEKQKLDMKTANFLILALEIASSLNAPLLIKKLVSTLYNHLVPYFQMRLRPHILLQVLIKCHQFMRIIPQETFDANCRRITSCISFQIIKACQEQGEKEALRRLLISEIPIKTRKWRKFSQYIVQKPQLTEEEREKYFEQQKRMELGENIPQDQLIKEPEIYEERLISLDEFEAEGEAFEEFILSYGGEYNEIIKAKIEAWLDQIKILNDQVSGGEQTTSIFKTKITQKLEFWEQLKQNKALPTLNTLVQQRDQKILSQQAFTEFSCKAMRRALETGEFENYLELANKIRLTINIPEEDAAYVENLINERLGYLDKDIVRKQRLRFEALELQVKIMSEQSTLTGGNTNIGSKKLQQFIQNQKKNDQTQDDEQAVVLYENEEDKRLKQYLYLWVSEKFYLEAICEFLDIVQKNPLVSFTETAIQNCIFDDILQLDFTKFKQCLDEQQTQKRSRQESRAGAVSQMSRQSATEPKIEEVKENPRVSRVNKLLGIIARAAQYAKLSGSWIQLMEIIKYTWNIFTFQLISPFELTVVSQQTPGWHNITLIAEAALALLEYLQKGGKMRKSDVRQIDQIQNQKPSFTSVQTQKTVAFKFQTPLDQIDSAAQAGQDEEAPAEDKQKTQEETKKDSKNNTKDIDLNMFGSFIGLTIQSLMLVNKWESLVYISNRLNSSTNNEFASQLLPFIIFAQSTLHAEASDNTKQKQIELDTRIQQFENWKLTSKKKRSRTAMLTGEIPAEEIEFNRDKQRLEKEIFRLDVIENVLLSDKQSSESLFENIKRDANNCVESLKQCRKLYFQLGLEKQEFRKQELMKGPQHFEVTSKKKGMKVMTQMVIHNYKKCIEIIRKRQEKYLLIQALHELGNVLYSDGNLSEAEIIWNDCVDTIFQRLYVINSYREIFAANPQLANSFGSKQVLIGGIVLAKLAKLCYEQNNQQLYSECVAMAAEMFLAPAKLSLPHPQIASEYAEYQFAEFVSEHLLTDQQQIKQSDLVNALSEIAQALIDSQLFAKSLPLISLFEYFANQIVRSKALVVKARILKSHALIECGYIKEAITQYRKVIQMIDLPNQAIRQSELLQKQSGFNFKFPINEAYKNHLTPDHEENQVAIKKVMDHITDETETNLSDFSSPQMLAQLHFVRGLMMLRLGEPENVESLEKQDFRINLLKQAEDTFRNTLRKLQIYEEIAYLQQNINETDIKVVDKEEGKLAELKQRLAATYERAGLTQEKHLKIFKNSDEKMSETDQRCQRLNLILRLRLGIHRCTHSQGMLLESFYVLRQGLINFKAIAEGQFKDIETGAEAASKGSFKLPDILAGGAAGKDAKGAAAKVPPPAKDTKGKGAPAVDEDAMKKQEEKANEAARLEAQALREKIVSQERRYHSHISLWMQTKVELLKLLMSQKRYEDFVDCLAVTKLEAQSVKDELNLRKLLEIEFQLQVQTGDIREAIKTAEDINTKATKFHFFDSSLQEFYGNYSELLRSIGENQKAQDYIQKGRTLVWNSLKELGIKVVPQDINGETTAKVWEGRAKLPEEEMESAAQIAVDAKGKAKPADKGAKTDKNVKVDDEPKKIDEKVQLDFSKELDYVLKAADKDLNKSTDHRNIYLFGLSLAFRLDVRYAQFLSFSLNQHSKALQILTNPEHLQASIINLNPQLKFQRALISGYTNFQNFLNMVREFVEGFKTNNNYRNVLASEQTKHKLPESNQILSLPNYYEQYFKKFQDSIQKAHLEVELAIKIGKAEAVVYEYDLDIIFALNQIADICQIRSELRPRQTKYSQVDYESKMKHQKIEKLKKAKLLELEQAGLKDDLDESLFMEELKSQVDQWEEQKKEKENTAISGYKQKSINYRKAAEAATEAQIQFLDQQHELSLGQITDLTKIPKEVILELFEQSQVAKITTSKVKNFEFKDKTTVNSGELLAYLKSLYKETNLMTFGKEKDRLSKLISKLHRFLLANLQTYAQKCVFVVEEVKMDII